MKYVTDGRIIKDENNWCMGIFSAVNLLNDHEVKIQNLEAKLVKLKRLILLTDDAVSDVTMNDLTMRQWLEFIKVFPDEDSKSADETRRAYV